MLFSNGFMGGGKSLVLTAATVLVAGSSVFAQNTQTIKGVVRDAKNEPLVGVSIRVKGTTQGVATDLDGKYQLGNVPKDAVLEFSYVGMRPQSVSVKGQSTINVVLQDDSSQLSDLVVVAYGGKVRRNQVTNAISTVKSETFKNGVFSNPAQALSGAVAGLRVIQSSGSPGAAPTIVLRGGTHFDGSGSPLIVVDGQVRAGLNDINPEDIDDMQVLKDAGSTAIYGARASNGVVLITTKSGKSGKSEISFKAKAGFNFLNSPYTFVGAEDYIRYMRTAYNESKFTTKDGKVIAIAPQGNLTGKSALGLGNDVLSDNAQWNIAALTDANKHLLEQGWKQMADPLNPAQQIIYKGISPQDYNINTPAFSQDYNLSFSGGNDKGNYYAGFGYNHADGLPITSFYQRMSALLTGSYQVRPWLKSTTSFSYNRANWNSMPPKQTSENEYFGRISSVPPTARYESNDGKPLLGPSPRDGNQSFQTDKFFRDNQTDKFNFAQTIDISILKNLRLTLKGSWFYSEGMYESFDKDHQINPNGAMDQTRASRASYDRTLAQTYNAVLNYDFKIREHSVAFTAGAEYFDERKRDFAASGSGAPTDDFRDLGYTSTDEKKRAIDSNHSELGIMSYFGRATYDFAGKYLFSATLRSDGYSSLLGENRWGYFPGVSAGWVLTKEDFFTKALPFVSFAKLRASYGLNGNATGIGAYTLQGSYVSARYNGLTGFRIGDLPNPGLRWEKTATAEFGLDMGFLQNRLNVNIAYFDRLTSDKYASFDLPPTTGFSSIRNNNGKYRNYGIELELNAKVLESKDLSWTLGANLTYLRNKVVALPANENALNRQNGQEIYTGNKVTDQNGQLVDEKIWVGGYQEGQEPGLLVGYNFLGIYRKAEDIPGNLVVETGNDKGKKMYGPVAWAALSGADQEKNIPLQAGDAIWQDINGDGKIDSFDQVVIGNTTPHFTGGITSNLRYKGWNLSVRADYALGFWIMDNSTRWFNGNMQGTYAPTTDVFDTWSVSNPNAKYPRYVWADQLQAGNYNRYSTLFAYRGDYLALREVTLSYTLPKAWAKKVFCQDITLSATGQNLGYLTAAKTVASPESGGGGGSGYPLPRTLVFGLNVSF